MLERFFSRICEKIHPHPEPNCLMTIEPIRVVGSWTKWSSILDQIRSLIWLKAHGFEVRWALPLASFNGSLSEHVIVISAEASDFPASHHLKRFDQQALIKAARACAESDFV